MKNNIIYLENTQQNGAGFIVKDRKVASIFKKNVARPINTWFQCINPKIGIIAQNV